MLSKEVKQGEIIHKIFDVGDVKDMSYTDKDSGEVIKRLSFTITSNRRDRDRDIVEPSGAMTDNYAANPVMLWAHKYDEVPIARSVEMSRIKEAKSDGSVAHKIQAITEFQPDSNYQKNWNGVTGGMIFEMYRTKFLNAVSIGFDPHSWEPLELKDGESSEYDEMNGTRFLKWDMLEFSGVPVPSNPDALVDRKSYKKMLKKWANETIKMCDGDCPMSKGVIPYKQTTKAPEDAAWAAGTEVGAASVDDLKVMCAWFDSSTPEVKGSYKLPHHTQANKSTVWRGVMAAGNAIQGSRGGVDIPPGDFDGVKSHLGKHYAEFDKTPPWENKGVEGGSDMETKEIEALTKRIEELEATIKAGRVLSVSNEADLRGAQDHHTQGVKLTNGVLDKVTGKPADGPAPAAAPADAPAVDAPVPKPAPKDVEPVETKEEVTPSDEPIEAEQETVEAEEKFLVDEDMLKEVLQSYEGTGNAQSGPITSETED
jgi:hypothetical protein